MNKELKALAIAHVTAQGFRVINATGLSIVNQTCRIKMSKGVAIIEKHTPLAPLTGNKLNDLGRNSKQNVMAAYLLKNCFDASVDIGIDYWGQLTEAQRQELEPQIHGYSYEFFKG